MGKVVANMSMSLDGFIADPSDGVDLLFGWFNNGDVTTPTADERWSFHTSEASAQYLRNAIAGMGALIAGRHLFDVAGGWGCHHPTGAPVFVVTHTPPEGWPETDPPFTFVTDGVESAVAQAKAVAGEKNVALASANITQQCLKAGLVDEIAVDLVPVLMGDGIRFFDHLGGSIVLEGPTVIEGTGVTHLTYRVKPR